jgi:nucleoside-diphosphate-sugar epimerase
MSTPPPGLTVVTGAAGFIGRHLVAELTERGYPVRAIVRSGSAPLPQHPALKVREVRDILAAPWSELLGGADAVVHLAAVAHRGAPDEAEQRRVSAVNVDVVEELTRAAAGAGLRRLIFLSSVGVLGASSGAGAFDAHSVPAPHDFYSHTKLRAEHTAAAASAHSSLQLCIVRAPMVFGPQAPGNFARLLGAVRHRIPLPLASVSNRRSLISVWNLCDLLTTCLAHPRAPLAPVLAADEESVSTAQLVRLCAEALGTRARLFALPVALLRLACTLLGRPADFERLCGSLVIDSRETYARLDWQPPLTLREGLRRTAAAMRMTRGPTAR